MKNYKKKDEELGNKCDELRLKDALISWFKEELKMEGKV